MSNEALSADAPPLIEKYTEAALANPRTVEFDGSNSLTIPCPTPSPGSEYMVMIGARTLGGAVLAEAVSGAGDSAPAAPIATAIARPARCTRLNFIRRPSRTTSRGQHGTKERKEQRIVMIVLGGGLRLGARLAARRVRRRSPPVSYTH